MSTTEDSQTVKPTQTHNCLDEMHICVCVCLCKIHHQLAPSDQTASLETPIRVCFAAQMAIFEGFSGTFRHLLHLVMSLSFFHSLTFCLIHTLTQTVLLFEV